MLEPLVVVGAGGFAREILDVVDAINSASPKPAFAVVGVVDPNPIPYNLSLLEERGTKYLGSDEAWLGSNLDASYVVGIGDPRIRRRIDGVYSGFGKRSAPVLIHPLAQVRATTLPGDGSVICAGVQVSSNVLIGRHVHLNPGATVSADVTLAAYVSVNPGAILMEGVTVADEVLIGAGALVMEGLDIGQSSIVGANACAERNVLAGSVVKGAPAR